ncbi:NUDIX domain-containing protein [Sporomusa aerivorans]|uniref:NUDIX hydrolase n=1 Tax=Sporomusa aerivorans TaxID=204936 RepID=UPI00352A5B9D
MSNERLMPAEFSKRHNMKVATDVLIYTVRERNQDNPRKVPEKQLQLLMIQRRGNPFKGAWAIPGGVVENTESVDAAAYRELKEETNIDDVYIEQLYSWGDEKRDPRAEESPDNRAVSVSYMALVDSEKLDIKAGDDAADARWFSVEYTSMAYTLEDGKGNILGKEYDYSLTLTNEDGVEPITCPALVKVKHIIEGAAIRTEREVVNSDGIAFDHAMIIQYSLERLRNKVEYTNIAFNLMPELFTLGELQSVYEILLGKELLTPNFRKKMLSVNKLVIPTNHKKTEVGHRPSQLYRFNPEWFIKNV